MRSQSFLARVKSFVSDVLLWSFFVVGLAVSAGGAGAVLDGTAKTVATFAGIAVSLVTGSKITKKPKIKAFLASRPVLWFLFLFNGGVAAVSYLTMDGAKGIATAAGMGLVSLGALGGLVSNYRQGAKAAGEEAYEGYEAPYEPPVYEAPAAQPGYEAPQAQPLYGTPYQQPTYGASYQQPTYEAPYQQPTYEAPDQRQPVQGAVNRPTDDSHWA